MTVWKELDKNYCIGGGECLSIRRAGRMSSRNDAATARLAQ